MKPRIYHESPPGLTPEQEKRRKALERRLQAVFKALGDLGAEVVGHKNVGLYVEAEGYLHVMDYDHPGYRDEPGASGDRRQEAVITEVRHRSTRGGGKCGNPWPVDMGGW
jgi:hypothetical protein